MSIESSWGEGAHVTGAALLDGTVLAHEESSRYRGTTPGLYWLMRRAHGTGAAILDCIGSWGEHTVQGTALLDCTVYSVLAPRVEGIPRL